MYAWPFGDFHYDMEVALQIAKAISSSWIMVLNGAFFPGT